MKGAKTESITEFNWDNNETDFFGINSTPAETLVAHEEDDDAEIPPASKTKSTSTPVPSKSAKAKVVEQNTEDDDEEEEEDDVEFFNILNKRDKGGPAKSTTTSETTTLTGDESDEDEDEEAEKSQVKELREKGKPAPVKQTQVIPDDEDGEKAFFTTFAKELKEEGIFTTVDIPEEPISKEEAFELLDKEVDGRFQETLENFMEELTPAGIDFLKYAKSGGRSVAKFREMYADTELPMERDSLENEASQEKFLRQVLARVEKVDDEDLEDRIEYLKENGKMKKTAYKYYDQLEAEGTHRRKLLVENEENQRISNEQKAKERHEGLVKLVREKDEIREFKLTDEDKKTLPDYINRVSVKVGKNQFITPLWRDIQMALRDPEDLILLAKVLKSKFNFSSFEKKGITKQTKEVKSSLQNYAKGTKKITGVGEGSSKQLSEFF